jgi:DNA-directed RNA polymerase subunit H
MAIKKTTKDSTKKVPVKVVKTSTKKVKTKKSKFSKESFDVNQHLLVPKHTKLTEKEKENLFKTYNVNITDIPKILKTDPGIRSLDPKVGDVIRIERNSPTAGKTYFYRGVINE